MYWYEEAGNEKDVFVSTRIRLARNLVDYPFEPALSETGAKEITEKVKSALSGDGGYTFADISEIPEKEKASLVEKHMISPEFAVKNKNAAIAENSKKGICIMMCEEDHVRIQSIRPGLDLDRALEEAFSADDLLDAKLNIAYDEKIGYLTHCPTNLGTGMRASVMMFLPVLTMSGRIKGVERELSQLGLTVRGVTGEGSASKGSLYQFSNCVTEGLSEQEIVGNLREAVGKIADSERALRKKLKEENADSLKDKVMRSAGVLGFAHMMTTEELYGLYSDVRLGVSAGIIGGITESDMDSLLVGCMPATLSANAENKLSPRERDKMRASKIREFMKKINVPESENA